MTLPFPSSQRALARALGLSAPVVTRLKARGMPVDSVEAARAWRAENLDPARAKWPDVPRPEPRPAPRPAPREEAPERISDFHTAKTRRETAEAHLAELKFGELSGQLLRRDTVERAVYDAFRSLRDHAFAAPQRVAPRLVELRDVREIEALITGELRRAFDGWEARMAERLGGRAQESKTG